MTEALIIQKPVHWFMEQINVLVSIWYGPPSWKSKTHFRPIFTYISIKSTHFKPLYHLYTPWKRQKIFQYPLFLGSTEKFSDVFRRYRNGTLAWNGLKWTIGWKQVKVYPSQKFSAFARNRYLLDNIKRKVNWIRNAGIYFWIYLFNLYLRNVSASKICRIANISWVLWFIIY